MDKGKAASKHPKQRRQPSQGLRMTARPLQGHPKSLCSGSMGPGCGAVSAAHSERPESTCAPRRWARLAAMRRGGQWAAHVLALTHRAETLQNSNGPYLAGTPWLAACTLGALWA